MLRLTHVHVRVTRQGKLRGRVLKDNCLFHTEVILLDLDERFRKMRIEQAQRRLVQEPIRLGQNFCAPVTDSGHEALYQTRIVGPDPESGNHIFHRETRANDGLVVVYVQKTRINMPHALGLPNYLPHHPVEDRVIAVLHAAQVELAVLSEGRIQVGVGDNVRILLDAVGVCNC